MAVILNIFALLCFYSAGCASIGQHKGREDARRDLANGILAQETFGLPAKYFWEYSKLLRDRYGIELRMTAGCKVRSGIIDHAAGYNKVMDAEIERRFGAGIWEATMDEARMKYDATKSHQHSETNRTRASAPRATAP